MPFKVTDGQGVGRSNAMSNLAPDVKPIEPIQAAKNAFAASCRLARSVLIYIEVVERLE